MQQLLYSQAFFLFNLNYSRRPVKNISFQGEGFKQHMLDLGKKVVEGSSNDNIHFEFEINESSSFVLDQDSNHEISDISVELRKLGITLAIDDFGIKQSSINRLIEYSFETIKIDKSFVDKLVSNKAKEARAVIRAITTIAEHLKLQIVAEGVETEDQVKVLQALLVPCIQGYIYHKPMELNRFIELLKKEV